LKTIKLEKLLTVIGKPFRKIVTDAAENPIFEEVLSAQGKPITGNDGVPVTRPKTEVMGNDALLFQLERLYLNMPADKMTRLDTFKGTELMRQIRKAREANSGTMELSEEVYAWVQAKLADEAIGVKVFGANLTVIEEAVARLVVEEKK
jgi:hypothetical protein